MPAPIIRKIPGLHKRIVGLISGISDPSGVNTFNKNTHQNIHKSLLNGVGGLQIGHDFIIPPTDAGSNIVRDGDFKGAAQSANITGDNWTTGAGWTIQSGKAVASGDSGNIFQENTELEDSKTYRVTYTISNYTKGNLRVILYADSLHKWGTTRASNGTFTEDITLSNSGGSHTNRIYFQTYNSSDEDFQIDNISVKPITPIEKRRGANQNLGKLFDGLDETSVTIKHNEKHQWIVFDLGKKRNLDRIIIENGPKPGGGVNAIKDLNASWWFWSDKNPTIEEVEQKYSTPDIHHEGGDEDYTNIVNGIGNQNGDVTTLDLSDNNTKYQYVGFKINGSNLSNYNDGYLNFKNFEIYESFDTRDYIVEFNDSVLDMHSWTGTRYKGCKTTGKKINEYFGYSDGGFGIGFAKIGYNFTVGEFPPLSKWIGDTTYGKTPNVENKTTALYITNTVIGGTEEEDKYARIKHHSYINIDKILIINLNDDSVKILDRETEDFAPFHRFITTDFPTSGKFNIKVLDNYIQNNLKTEYHVKMNKGWLLKSFEYNADSAPLPGMDFDGTTELNTTSLVDSNVRNTIANPLSLYDAVSGSIQFPDRIYGYNKQLQEHVDNDPLGGGTSTGLYGCNQTVGGTWCANKDTEDMRTGVIKSLYDVFSFGPNYGEICDSNVNNNPTLSDYCLNGPFGSDGLGDTYNTTSDGKRTFISVNRYNQHAGGDFRFRFGVTNQVDDITGVTPKQTFQPLYTGDNTRFLSNKFTRKFIQQDNNSQLAVKNFNFPTIAETSANSGQDFSTWVKDAKINPSITASVFIGQCVQYLNSQSKDTELHLTLFEGTKDFSGNNDEMSIGTFEVDRNVNSGYLDFAENEGKLYNTIGPRAKYLKLKNSPQFRPSIQPVKYDRFIYDTIETSDYQAVIEERQNAFVFGPGTINTNLDQEAGYYHDETQPLNSGEVVATYDNNTGNSDNFSGSFNYELSFLDKDHTLIADIDKNAELFDGIGGQGAVLIPEHTHEAVKINLYYYLNKAGMIERTTKKKRVKPI